MKARFKPASLSRVDEKHFEKWVFPKWWRHDYSHVISLTEFISNADSKFLRFKFLRSDEGGEHLMRFKSETSVFQIP